MSARTEEPRESTGDGDRPVRGPFVNLAPHRHHTDDIEAFLNYTERLHRSGERLAADFFSGGGGLSLGLEKAGYTVVLGADHEPFANRTHAHHFGGMSLDWDLADPEVVGEVAELCRAAQVDLIAGGLPGQPFSKAGRSTIRHQVESGLRDRRDQRRELWRSFLEIIRLAKPRAVMMESVPDMALDRDMSILRSIVESLEQLGYSVEGSVLDAWRYGVPQSRQCLLIVALKGQTQFAWPSEVQQRVTLWNAIGDLPEVEGGWRPKGGAEGWSDYSGPHTHFQREMRSAIAEADAGEVFDHITRPVRDDDREAFEGMTHHTKYTDLSAEHRRYRDDIFVDKYKRLDENDLSRTITAHIAKDGYSYIHPRQSRTLTVREAARLQTFPDHFRFDGPPSAAFRQIGNAFPPQLGFVIGAAVLSSLERADHPRISTGETSLELAGWFRQRADSLTLPWLNAGSRWDVVAGEVLLDRASAQLVRRLWPVVQQFGHSTPGSSAYFELREGLLDASRTIGRLTRAEAVVALADRITDEPGLLDGPADQIKKSTGLPGSVTDLATLVVPGGSWGDEDEGIDEPVLVTKGVLRVAGRFQANDVERKNKMTDGRLAVARMIGFGPDARHAHLGLIELANSLCRPERPACTECPLVAHCAHGGV